jgi:hypothetical protein
LLVPVKFMGHNRFKGEDLVQFIAEQTHDDVAVIRGALMMLSEAHAEEDRELCPSCTKRRVNRGHSLCTRCEEQHELQLAHKRKWWNEKGTHRRSAAQRDGASADDGEDQESGGSSVDDAEVVV